MANQNYRIFPNKVELFKFFGAYIPELNISASSRLPLNGFVLGKQMKVFPGTCRPVRSSCRRQDLYSENGQLHRIL